MVSVDDGELARILTETSLAQFLEPTLDERDRHDFASLLEKADPTRFAKVDCAPIVPDRTYPGVYMAPTVTLLEREARGYRPVAIRVGERVVRPDDGADWTLAKLFALQNMHVLMTIVMHPRLHLPLDVVNAVSQTLLPRGHVLSKLLAPHLRFTLGLHRALVYHRRSIFHNSQRELYGAYPFDALGIRRAFEIGMRGVPGNSAYPPYRYDAVLRDNGTPYARYRRDWFEAIFELVSAVCDEVPGDDPVVRRWADRIHAWLPSFPDGGRIFEPGELARAVSIFIATVSVFHTADHHSYANIDIRKMPFRLRVPPPSAEPTRFTSEALVSREDFLRHQLCHAMFFAPVIITRLSDVRYRVGRPAGRAAEQRFRDRMCALDTKWEGRGFPASHQIASSLQY